MPESGAAYCEFTIDFGFAFPADHDPEFSVHEVVTIQRRYLSRTLKLLVDERASKSTKQQVIDWVAAQFVPADRIEEISVVAFQCCCLAECVDPVAMRESVLRRFAPDRLADLGDD